MKNLNKIARSASVTVGSSSSMGGGVGLFAGMPTVASKDLLRLLFLHERNLYFGRCFLMKKFNSNTKFFFTVKEATEGKFKEKYKKEGENNLDTIKAFKKDHEIAICFGVDPLDEGNIKLQTGDEKFDKIFHVNAIKERHKMKELFEVSALLLKDDGELHMLFNKEQYDSMKIDDVAKAAGICYKEIKEVTDEECGSFSLEHVKAEEDSVFYVFQLSPTPKAGGSSSDSPATQKNGSDPSVTHPQPGEDAAPQVGYEDVSAQPHTPALNEGEMQPVDGLPLLLEDEKIAPKSILKKGSNVDMLDGVAVVRSEKIKDELVSKGNDTELDSRSCAVIHQVNLLDAEKVKDQLVLDGNDIGKD